VPVRHLSHPQRNLTLFRELAGLKQSIGPLALGLLKFRRGRHYRDPHALSPKITHWRAA